MKSENNNNLTDHIRQTLLDHEEPYELGSWERFQKQAQLKATRKRRRMMYAAAVLLALSLALGWNNWETTPEQTIAEQTEMDQPDMQHPPESRAPALSEGQVGSKETSPKNGNLAAAQQSTPAVSNQQVQEPLAKAESFSGSGSADFSTASAPIGRATLTQVITLSDDFKNPPATLLGNKSGVVGHSRTTGLAYAADSTHIAALSPNSDLPRVTEIPNNRILTFSAAYAPMVHMHASETDLGMGGGFYTDWNFSRRLTLSSGLFIAQNQLKYNQAPSTAEISTDLRNEGFSSSSPTGPELAYMQLDMINLEIPLNLRFNISNQVSVSAGVSSLTFLKEKYEYVFQYQQNIQVFDVRSASEDSEPRTRIVSLSTSRSRSGSSMDKIDWAAFYTFSVGYQRRVFKEYRASLEPFIKIPAGQVTSLGVSYTTGGLQLKISF